MTTDHHPIDLEQKIARIGNLRVHLSQEYEASQNISWLGQELPESSLQAAWMRLSEDDLPMNPRLVGKPGVGKTTLAVGVARGLGLPVYLMQGTSDTRPDDLIITPVITDGKQVSYVASPLVTAMLVGGVCVLDEGNRMSEKSWASLAPLLDHRRYVDSVIAGVRIAAHPEFRFVTTMNDDASVFDLPEYIQSRLAPQIFLDFADPETEKKIIQSVVPYTSESLLEILVQFLATSHHYQNTISVRDGIQVAKYAIRLQQSRNLTVSQALMESIISILGEEALKYYPPDPDPTSGINSKRGSLKPV